MEFEILLIEHLSWLYRKAFQYCLNKSDAEDLTHETIERMLNNRGKYNWEMSFRPWAMAVMQNIYIGEYNRRRRMTIVSIDDYERMSCAHTDSSVALSNILSVIRACARESVAIECVVLYAKGYSYSEISRMLKIPLGTVMSRISNGRKILRKVLE